MLPDQCQGVNKDRKALKGCPRTATVPKIAPLAPTEGIPTNEKLPPSTFLKDGERRRPVIGGTTYPNIPAAKYVNKNPPEPISRSI